METNFKDNPKLRLQIYKQILELLLSEVDTFESISYYLCKIVVGANSQYKLNRSQIEHITSKNVLKLTFPEVYFYADTNWNEVPLNVKGRKIRIELIKSSIRVVESKINQVGGGEEMFKKATLSIEVKVTPKTFWQRLFSKMRFWK